MELDEDGIEVDGDMLEAVFELWNAAPDQDLAGLSPNALTELLDDPFEATDVLVFSDVLPRDPCAPVTTLLAPLFDALLASPVRATASGYLPPALCRSIERHAVARHGRLPLEQRRSAVRGESSFLSLHVARLTATAAGLIRLRRGRFEATRRGRQLYERRGLAGIYPPLLEAYATRLEWSSLDPYPRAGIVQASFAFSLALLIRFGRTPRLGTFYAERWLRAFPGTEEAFEYPGGAPPPGSRSLGRSTGATAVPLPRALGRGRAAAARRRFERCYQARVLEHFFGYFGLAIVEPSPGDGGVSLRSSELLHDAVALRHGG
jgi:hypothetical protein